MCQWLLAHPVYTRGLYSRNFAVWGLCSKYRGSIIFFDVQKSSFNRRCYSDDFEYRLWSKKYVEEICKTTQIKQFLNYNFCFLWWFWRKTDKNTGAITRQFAICTQMGGGGLYTKGLCTRHYSMSIISVFTGGGWEEGDAGAGDDCHQRRTQRFNVEKYPEKAFPGLIFWVCDNVVNVFGAPFLSNLWKKTLVNKRSWALSRWSLCCWSRVVP